MPWMHPIIKDHPLQANQMDRYITTKYFDIKHLKWSKLGLIDYLSKKLVSPALPASIFMRNLCWQKLPRFFSQLEVLDNIVLKEITNRKRAPLQLIDSRKKESKRQIDCVRNSKRNQLHSHFQQSKTKIQKTKKPINSKSTLRLPIIEIFCGNNKFP